MARNIVDHISIDDNDKRTNMPASLWHIWWEVMLLLRPAFTRSRTFLWFVLIVAGLTIHQDYLGATSIVRALRLKEKSYHSLLRTFHSTAIHLDTLSCLWIQVVIRLFPKAIRVRGRRVIVGDGIKVAKRGKRMPAAKFLHQQSENKAEFIMGHSLQAICLLVEAGQSVAAVPLIARIHEGIVFSNRSGKTLLDKMLELLSHIKCPETFYFVADAYYAAKTMANGLQGNGHHLITRVKSNATAYMPAETQTMKSRGRPKLYGQKITLKNVEPNEAMMSPVYGETAIQLRYAVVDALWRSLGRVVRFVKVEHPTRGSCILMTTDLDLSAEEIIRTYGMRFKIEYTFKQAVHQIGTFAYKFWMKTMRPQKYGAGNQYPHHETVEYRNALRRKVHAYHIHIQAGIVAQGLMQYLAVTYPRMIWSSFGSWLRTIRPNLAPSELVVAEALRQSLPHFLMSSIEQHALRKFMAEHQRVENVLGLDFAA